jgi:hypothetical protein
MLCTAKRFVWGQGAEEMFPVRICVMSEAHVHEASTDQIKGCFLLISRLFKSGIVQPLDTSCLLSPVTTCAVNRDDSQTCAPLGFWIRVLFLALALCLWARVLCYNTYMVRRCTS